VKGANLAPVERAAVEAKKEGRKVSALEYVAIAIIVIVLIAVIVLTLNKFGVIHLPFTLPISWLNPSATDALLNMGIF
jgi:hypothetical protein